MLDIFIFLKFFVILVEFFLGKIGKKKNKSVILKICFILLYKWEKEDF